MVQVVAGKGTIAQMLALELDWNILDSGALYRTLAYFMKEKYYQFENFEENQNLLKRDLKFHLIQEYQASP